MKPFDWMDPQDPLNGVMLCFCVVVPSFAGIILCTMGRIALQLVVWVRVVRFCELAAILTYASQIFLRPLEFDQIAKASGAAAALLPVRHVGDGRGPAP